MGYYMRYIVTDDRPLSIAELDAALKATDSAYKIKDGDLYHGADLYDEIEISLRGEELCDEELGELVEFAEDSDGEHKQQVLEALRDAKSIVAIRVLWQGGDSEATLKKLDPLWEWLFSNRQVQVQADGEGYYDASGLILEVE